MQIFSFFSHFFSGNRAKRRAIYGALFLATLLVIGMITAIGQRGAKADEAHAIPLAAILPLTGEQSSVGKDILQGIQLYINSVNDSGGVNGQSLKLLTFDDQSNPDIARQRAQEIVNSPAMLVLGHWSSTASGAAGEIYKAGKIAAITGTAFADTVTRDNPYYFRTTYTNSQQGSVIATYIQRQLGFRKAIAIYTDDNYGRTVRAGFEPTFKQNGGDLKQFVYNRTTGDNTQQIQAIVDAIAADPAPGMIYLGMIDTPAEELIGALKRRGIRAPIFATEYGKEAGFQQYAEEQKQPGFFINGVYAAAPLIFDSANADAQDFVSTYRSAYGIEPGWPGANFYDATRIAVEALKAANIKSTAPLQQNREQIRSQLATLNKPTVAFRSLTGPIYFDDQRNAILPVRVGRFQQRKFISAPVQFTPLANQSSLDQQREEKAGNLIQINNQLLWRQRVVYTGIDINKLSRIDQNKSSFTASFNIWFRYSGDDEPLAIQFPDAATNILNPSLPVFDAKTPLKSQTIEGLNYRLYQVTGEFKNSFDLHNYPFDSQKVVVRFLNTHLSSDRLIYVLDTLGLKLPRTDLEQQKRAFAGLQLWKFKDIQYAQDTIRTTSTLGDPALFESSVQTDYPGFRVGMRLQRNTLVFLSKNLLPLLLLILINYSTLYFSYALAVPRIVGPLSTLLSGIVLLLAINNQLPEIGYAVAIEYTFYVFFFLSLFVILVTAIGERLSKTDQKQALNQLNWFARLFYPLVVLGTIIIYLAVYGTTFV